MICQDKALSKKILKHHRVGVPPFVVSRKNRPLGKLDPAILPALVKPLAEEGSVGISKESFAETEEQALKRAAFLHDSLSQDAIIEHYIEGRELYIAVLGDSRLKVLPPRELRFSNVPHGEPKYASFKAKWSNDYRERWGIFNTFADDLEADVLSRIERVSRRVFRVLQMSSFGRIDMRLRNDGKLFVMEANPNPAIAMFEDFAESARRAGIPYNDLIERIARMGLAARVP
jgi:D-alanine-D-alanine ligase